MLYAWRQTTAREKPLYEASRSKASVDGRETTQIYQTTETTVRMEHSRSTPLSSVLEKRYQL